MIKLEIKDYCQSCTAYESADERINTEIGPVILVRCKYRDICRTIYKSIMNGRIKDD